MKKLAKTFVCGKCGQTKKRKYEGGRMFDKSRPNGSLPVCKLCTKGSVSTLNPVP